MPNRASVLVPFCIDPHTGKPAILFTQRSFSLQKHKGEICFPGGFEEAGDRDVIDSAVRELIEEIGVRREDVHVYGALNPVPFREIELHPVLGHLTLGRGELKINPDEVDSVHVVPLDLLTDSANWHRTQWAHGWTTPVFLHPSGHPNPRIWGMTGSILYLLLANLMPRQFHFDTAFLSRGHQ